MKRRPLLSALVFLAGCPMYHESHPAPRPMATPVPIDGINSPYDDFNSADARLWYRHDFVFSTNRGSKGANFDLYESRLQWEFPQSGAPTPVRAEEPKPVAQEVMSDRDERGPLVLRDQGSRPRLVFASNRDGGQGGLDLYVAELDWDTTGDHVIALRPLAGLNSPADDAYLSAPIADHQMLFASNRGRGDTDIWLAAWDARDSIEAAPHRLERVAALSSPADDTAPHVYRNAHGETEVVFASARAGSLGEHDLYCSRYVDPRSEHQRESDEELHASTPQRVWTPPVHLRAFSSPRDEYRPIVIDVNGTRYMIFSSTREGGRGGYDLYVVGYEGCPAA